MENLSCRKPNYHDWDHGQEGRSGWKKKEVVENREGRKERRLREERTKEGWKRGRKEKNKKGEAEGCVCSSVVELAQHVQGPEFHPQHQKIRKGNGNYKS